MGSQRMARSLARAFPTVKRWPAHNIHNQYGMHRFFNNQAGGAIARNCTGYNGRGCQGAQAANTYADYNYTPYNSVVLAPN